MVVIFLVSYFYVFNPGARRTLFAPFNEFVQIRFLALCKYFNRIVIAVFYLSGYMQFVCLFLRGLSKKNALDTPGYFDMFGHWK